LTFFNEYDKKAEHLGGHVFSWMGPDYQRAES
jgi:hypothetical protein